jgi:fibronectin type 3 domain-containing protein
VNFTASLLTSFVVDLTWDASTSGDVVGYNVYRGDASGGPYTKLNTFPVGLTHRDDTVGLGRTYYYVVTATTASETESTHSNEASAVIPSS